MKTNLGHIGLILVLVVLCAVQDGRSANILGVLPLLIRSHYNAIHPIFMELSRRGHNVTVISAYKEKNTPPNYRHIQADPVTITSMFQPGAKEPNFFEIMAPRNVLIQSFFVYTLFGKLCERALESKAIQDFILYDESHFDAVIVEDLRFLAFYMFAHKYKAPLITVSSFGCINSMDNSMGNPMSLHYIPHIMDEANDVITLWQRTKNVIYNLADLLVKDLYFDGKNEAIAETHFRHLPKPLPTSKQIENNISLLLLNSHYSMDIVRPFLPNMVEVGGLHIERPKQLPEDLQKILDTAKEGAIFFSMGSNLKATQFPKYKKDALLKVFSELKQIVLWKWEEDTLPGQPKNVIIRKWFPQTDILAHPNVRLFITHGGLLSLQEAVYRGVPIIGIPIYGDQPKNIGKAKAAGYAEDLDYQTLSENSIKTAIEKVLNDPSYTKTVKEMSARIIDKPMTALDTAMYWVEYVIRHKGAYHLKTPSSFMTWYEYFLVDVTLILVAGITIVIWISLLCLRFSISLVFKRSNKLNIKKKQ